MHDVQHNRGGRGHPVGRYIVTGAAGHLGGTIMRMLAGAGAQARGLLLPGEEPVVTSPGLTYLRGDVTDPVSLRPLFEGFDGPATAVIHTAAIISIARRMPPHLHEVNVDGVRNILALCREHAVGRLVHVSSVHAIPVLPEGEVMGEPDSFSPDLVVGGYAKTKAEAAQLVLDAAEDGLDACIVFPSGILGPNDTGGNHLVQLVRDTMEGRIPACVPGGYDFVDVRDVARGCLLAAERGRWGEGYILSGRYLSIRDLLNLVTGLCGRREVRAVPIWLAELAVPFVALSARIRGTRPLYTRYSLHTLGVNATFSSAKARTHLGFDVRPIEETVADTVAWLRHSAHIPRMASTRNSVAPGAQAS